MNNFLLHMKSYPLWEDMEEQILSLRPIIPSYTPGSDNTEKWKHESSRQEGFDILTSLLKIGVHDE